MSSHQTHCHQKRYLDIDTWHRRDQFNFFTPFEQPFFNVTVLLDVTHLHKFCKNKGLSFFIASLHVAIDSANEVESFRYRIESSSAEPSKWKICVHPRVEANCTVLNPDQSFSFVDFGYNRDFIDFYNNAQTQLDAIKRGDKNLDPQADKQHAVHFSVLPWLHFTSFEHANMGGQTDSIPKIVMGKFEKYGEQLKMPVSIRVHHGLMDGLHVGQFVHTMQTKLDSFEEQYHA